MAKIALLSDIHGNILALEAVVRDLQRHKVDAVLNLGDHLSGPLWPRETADFLMNQSWVHLAGNHDRQLVTIEPARQGLSDRYASQQLEKVHLEWLRSQVHSTIWRNDVALFHGTPRSDAEYLLETVEHGKAFLATPKEITTRLGECRARLMVCGHSHVPRVVAIDSTCLIVNPGSVGLQAYEDDGSVPHIIETGSPHARYAIVEELEGTWRTSLMSVAYDFSRAAGRAKSNGRPEWEAALRTGFMS